jgi:MoaA/NifB/PqqE/SkfB family radical SAM enzyme
MTALGERPAGPLPRLIEQFELGLAAPICLTWELTYACNLACVHCWAAAAAVRLAQCAR